MSQRHGVPNVTDSIIHTGFNCQVRIDRENDDGASAEVVALVTSFQATEDFQAQDAVVIGHLGPVSIDPQGYTCNITMDGFLPSKKYLEDNGSYNDGGTEALRDHVPRREDWMKPSGRPRIAYLDFFSPYEKERGGSGVLAKFKGVIITNAGISSEGNSYVRNNVQARALERF